jgi:hypothetical protein
MDKARIVIRWGEHAVMATLESTPSTAALLAVLPCDASANTWGEEVYFSVPLACRLEADARQVVDPGTVCFWVEGRSLALPYGPTPVSRGSECRLVAKVNVLGRVDGDPRTLASIRDGDPIRVERV